MVIENGGSGLRSPGVCLADEMLIQIKSVCVPFTVLMFVYVLQANTSRLLHC